ncbi:MAG: flagellar basal body-associated FliL family protein [Armatimonadetes bacterium]|nr:flagellar basal body-associated FliL family protein [Armatimonadota bacterium]
MKRDSGLRDGKAKLILVVLAALLIGGAAGGFAVRGAFAKKEAAQPSAENKEAAEKESQQKAVKKSAEETSAIDEKRSRGEIVNIGEFLLNVASTDRLRYVKCEIALQVIGLPEQKKKGHGEEGKGPFSDEQMAWVKDAVVRVFADTPFEQLKTGEGREKLRKRLAAAIEEVLGGPAVRQVLFTSFVMQ